jgi:hypothetical protein
MVLKCPTGVIPAKFVLHVGSRMFRADGQHHGCRGYHPERYRRDHDDAKL